MARTFVNSQVDNRFDNHLLACRMSERLLKAHPQLTVHSCSTTGSKEYRVENWKPLKDGSIPTSAWTFFDYVVVAVFAVLQVGSPSRWTKLSCPNYHIMQARLDSHAHWIAASVYIWLKCNTIVWGTSGHLF